MQLRLYFEGSTVHFDQQNVRKAVIAQHANRTGFLLRDTSKEKKLNPDRPEGGRQSAEFCLAPGGQAGGFGLRELESIIFNCIPLYVNDNVSRYYEEVLSFDEFEVALPEGRIPEIPDALERAAPGQRGMRERGFCACHALAPSWKANRPEDYWEAWCVLACVSDASLACERTKPELGDRRALARAHSIAEGECGRLSSRPPQAGRGLEGSDGHVRLVRDVSGARLARAMAAAARALCSCAVVSWSCQT